MVNQTNNELNEILTELKSRTTMKKHHHHKRTASHGS